MMKEGTKKEKGLRNAWILRTAIVKTKPRLEQKESPQDPGAPCAALSSSETYRSDIFLAIAMSIVLFEVGPLFANGVFLRFAEGGALEPACFFAIGVETLAELWMCDFDERFGALADRAAVEVSDAVFGDDIVHG